MKTLHCEHLVYETEGTQFDMKCLHFTKCLVIVLQEYHIQH